MRILVFASRQALLSSKLLLAFQVKFSFHSDNQAAVQIINKGITASPVVMNALRTLFWLSALYNFHITVVYLAGTDNALAVSISRMHETTGLHNFYAFLRLTFRQIK